MPELPSHVSPALQPQHSPGGDTAQPPTTPLKTNMAVATLPDSMADLALDVRKTGQDRQRPTPQSSTPPSATILQPHSALRDVFQQHSHSGLPSLVSPAFTPPTTPGTHTPRRDAGPPVTESLSLGGANDSTPPFSTDASAPSTLPQQPPTPAPLVDRLPLVTCVVRARIPTTTGVEMFLHLYHNDADNKEHLAIVFGSQIRSRSLDAVRPGETEWDRMVRGAYVGRLRPGRVTSGPEGDDEEPPLAGDQVVAAAAAEAPLVRIHSACYTGETVWSARCDCGEQLDEAARLMSHLPAASPGGAIVYLQQEGRGIGLASKLAAYNLQDLGKDTYEANVLLRHPADARSYGLATAMLVDLGLGGERGIRLLTNNPDKVRAVEGPSREVRVRERVPMVPVSWRTGGREGVRGEEVERYLSTKVRPGRSFLLLSSSPRLVRSHGGC